MAAQDHPVIAHDIRAQRIPPKPCLGGLSRTAGGGEQNSPSIQHRLTGVQQYRLPLQQHPAHRKQLEHLFHRLKNMGVVPFVDVKREPPPSRRPAHAGNRPKPAHGLANHPFLRAVVVKQQILARQRLRRNRQRTAAGANRNFQLRRRVRRKKGRQRIARLQRLAPPDAHGNPAQRHTKSSHVSLQKETAGSLICRPFPVE